MTQPDEVNLHQEYFLGSIDCSNDEPFTTNIRINGQRCKFKIDTGADVCIMSEATKLEPSTATATNHNRPESLRW